MLQPVQDALKESLVNVLVHVPVGVLIVVFVGYVVVSMVQILRSDQTEFFRGAIKTRRDHQLRSLLEKVKEEATALSALVPLFNFFNAELADLIADLGDRPDSTSERITRLYNAVLAGVTQVTRSPGFHRAAILLPEGPGGTLPLGLTRSLHFSSSAQQGLKFDSNSIPGRVFSSGEAYYCQDTEKDRYFQKNPQSTHTYRSFVCVPIRVRGRNLGVLLVDAVPPDAFANDDINLLHVFARYAGVLRQIELLVEYSVGEVARLENEE